MSQKSTDSPTEDHLSVDQSKKNQNSFKDVAIIGLGLIGGSIASALKQQGSYVTAFDITPQNLDDGVRQGVIDEAADSVESACGNASLVILAVPVLQMPALFKQLVKLDDIQSKVITDVGSVKGQMLESLLVDGPLLANFVPGHPIAGSEKHGVLNSDPTLFAQHKVILTPHAETDTVAINAVASMWRSLGAEVSEMSPTKHDLILAQTSHLPHLLAYALIDSLSDRGDSLEIFDYAAGGLRDFSRIAASDPTMWRDIFSSNKEALIDVLDRYVAELAELRRMIETDDQKSVYGVLDRAKSARDHFSQVLKDREKK
ncbi:MAG: prephenate dehydrogenase/arogenate dehydrogenase family protein [Pseudomonadales bacterium]|jgi:prephenate dehydrogenase|tara:strand:+ start:17808 stop:18755 length:948 start_codon:yes stop_codon:yes gene_type:complete